MQLRAANAHTLTLRSLASSMATWETIDSSKLSVCEEPAAAPPRYVCTYGYYDRADNASTCYDGDLMVVRVNDRSKVKDYTFYGPILA